MGKNAQARAVPDNEAKAVGRMIRVSPQKLNLVASNIRGLHVEKALAELSFSRRRIAGDVTPSQAVKASAAAVTSASPTVLATR